MSMRNRHIVTAVLVMVLAACTTVPNREEQGVVIGAIAGGILGHQVGGGTGQVLATFVGTIAGAAIGGSIGRSMDDVDRLKTAAALENVRTGVSTAWVNPDTGYEYVVTPTRTYDEGTGPCREYTLDATIGGRTEQVWGTACRQADGSWRIMP